jgi:hypothetical protein
VRLPRGGLRDAVEDALPRLPEIFDRLELERALGFIPRRFSLVRILKDLWSEKTLEIVEYSGGRRPTNTGNRGRGEENVGRLPHGCRASA